MMQSQSENHSLNSGIMSSSNDSISNLTDVLISATHSHSGHGIALAGWRWEETSTFIVVSLFLLTGSLVKLAYHHTSLHQHLPESCILILLGTAFELMSFASHFQAYFPRFSSQVFFFLLLPPIILESAYSLHDRIFFTNLGTILLYAIAGTLLNIFSIGPVLYAIGLTGVYGSEIPAPLSLIECLIFSTLISAVDPVAVLAIFQEIGVNKALYFLVFGESLLNDAVVITLYNSITIFAGSVAITPLNLLLGGLNFLTVSGGGLAIGIVWGVLTALITKYTQEVRVVEPMIVIVIAYLAYVTSELFHFSGIIGIIGCGLMQLEYAKYNISNRSYITIKYFTRNVSTVADVIIFFFLGKVLVRENHVWSTGFVLIATAACVVFRFVSVFSLTWIANNVFQRIHRIKLEEQLVMAYGGLRGAIAFSLAISLDESEVRNARLFVSSTLFVILFTVFVLGSTTKTIVRLLRVQTEVKEDPKMFLFTNDKLIEGLMSGLEDVTGNQTYFHWIHRLSAFNEKYVKRFLVRNWNNYTEFATTYQKVRSKTSSMPRSILSAHSIVVPSAIPRAHVGRENESASAVASASDFQSESHSSSSAPFPRVKKKTAVVISPSESLSASTSSLRNSPLRNGGLSMNEVTVSTAAIIATNDDALVNKIRGRRLAFETDSIRAINHNNNMMQQRPQQLSADSNSSSGGWHLIRNVVNFTSRLRKNSNVPSSTTGTSGSMTATTGSSSTTMNKDRSRRRRSSGTGISSPPASGTSSRKQSIVNLMMMSGNRENSEERERNEARRQLSSALNRTSFFQLPGSIFIEDIEEDALKRRSATRNRMQRDSIPSGVGHSQAHHRLTESSYLLGRGPEDRMPHRRRSSVHEENVSRTMASGSDASSSAAGGRAGHQRTTHLSLGSSQDRSHLPFP